MTQEEKRDDMLQKASCFDGKNLVQYGRPMPATEAQANSPQNTQANFTQTHWSLVVQAANSSSPEAREKLNELCQKYWYPLYAFIRRQGHDSHKAKDLTQSFFVHLLEKDLFKRANPQKGKFRSFLLASLTNFMRDEWRKENAQVRGGAIASISIDEVEGERKYHSLPSHEPDPSKIFDRSWAVTLIESATKQLRDKYADKIQVYDALQPYLSGESGRGFYAKVAEEFGGQCIPCLLRLGVQQLATPILQTTRDLPLPQGGEGRGEGVLFPFRPATQTNPAPALAETFGNYILVNEIARGGMGIVYKARDPALNRMVALKMILSGRLAGEAEIRRFHTEAEAAANLSHPNIVPIYEIGEHQSRHYFTMKFVQGESLAEQIARGKWRIENGNKKQVQ